MHKRRHMLPSSSWESLHPDILQAVAARLPEASAGNYGPDVDFAATLVCKAWRRPFLDRVHQTREGVLQPPGRYKLSGGLRLTPPEGWAKMVSSGGIGCLDLSRLPWADYSLSFRKELLKAANAYAVGIAQLAPAGLASLVLWLGDGCKATPGFVSLCYAPLVLRPLPYLKGLTSLEASLSWEGVGPLVSALRELLAADDCRLSHLRLRLLVPTYRDIVGSSSAAGDLDGLEWQNIAQDPAVQAAMQRFHMLRQLVEGHPDLSVAVCAKVRSPLGGYTEDPWESLRAIDCRNFPIGVTLGILDGAVTELELLDGGLPPGTPGLLRGVKRLEMVEDSLDPSQEHAHIHTDNVLETLAALPALEEVVLDVGGAAVSFPDVIRHGLAQRSPGISYLEAVGFWQKRRSYAHCYQCYLAACDIQEHSRNTGVMAEFAPSSPWLPGEQTSTRETLLQLGLVEGESLVLKEYRS